MSEADNFQSLVAAIRNAHTQSAELALQVINTGLTLRNWLIGHHIIHYEQRGQDRAQYGSRLLEQLAHSLQEDLDRCYTGRYLGLCRQFCSSYPDIGKSVISESTTTTPPNWTQRLLRGLSFTHFVELLKCEEP